MTMLDRVVDSASNMSRYRKLHCSRTKNVRCATRFLVSGHLLGTESQTFARALDSGFRNSLPLMAFLDRLVESASNMPRNRRLHCSRTTNVRCDTRFLVSAHLLGTESQTFSTFIVIGF